MPICEKDFKVGMLIEIIIKHLLLSLVKAVGHSCSVCSQIITGEVYVVDDKYYGEADFEAVASTGNCGGCGEGVGPDDSLSLGDILFHHSCLKCTVCSKNMEGQQVGIDLI